jgi:hypothetical protein
LVGEEVVLAGDVGGAKKHSDMPLDIVRRLVIH